jgi:hypothetical protein
MPLGPKPPVKALADGLNPSLLRLFVRDLLGESGFREIRDYDGVGDGGRDLQANDPYGEQCIIQLKYRDDPEAATSSNEFAELPIALMRLGCRRGLFITNGRITAPAKRDATNAYPGLKLTFMEGVDLLEALNQTPITSALWIQGIEIRKLQRRASFGIICRALPQDRSYFLDSLTEAFSKFEQKSVWRRSKSLLATVSRAQFDYADFEPFRPPELITSSEGFLSILIASELSLHGEWTIDQLPGIQRYIGRKIAKEWSLSPNSPQVCSIRISKPTIYSIDPGPKLKFSTKPITIVGIGGKWQPEREAIIDSLGVWQIPSWIQVYQVMRGQYYLLWSEQDLLCKISYTAMTSRAGLGMALRRRAHFDRWWGRSVFCLSPRRLLTDQESSDPLAPHLCYEWESGQWIATWLHPRLQGEGAERMLMGDERDKNYDPRQETQEESAYIRSAMEYVSEMKFERVEPIKAYHMNCIATGGKAAPSVMWRTHPTEELVQESDEIPSPIDLFDIDCQYTAAYILPNKEIAEASAASWSGWEDTEWSIHAKAYPKMEADQQALKFLAGTVNRNTDERLVLVTASRNNSPRLLLETKLEKDSAELPDLLERLERRAGVTREMRQSRWWQRERWRVFYYPEYPTPGDEQIMFVPEKVATELPEQGKCEC